MSGLSVASSCMLWLPSALTSHSRLGANTTARLLDVILLASWW